MCRQHRHLTDKSPKLARRFDIIELPGRAHAPALTFGQRIAELGTSSFDDGEQTLDNLGMALGDVGCLAQIARQIVKLGLNDFDFV